MTVRFGAELIPGTEPSGTELLITPEIYPLRVLARLPRERWSPAPRSRSLLCERPAKT